MRRSPRSSPASNVHPSSPQQADTQQSGLALEKGTLEEQSRPAVSAMQGMQTDRGTLPQDQGRCSIDATAGIIHATSSPEQSSHDPSAAANPALSASAQEYTEEGAQPLTGCQASTAGQGNDDQQTIDPAGVLENTTPQPTQVTSPTCFYT
ncbi:hypothetical protein OsI_34920 [Oryza sativa Indica Group]|uniref:Uncharacterized protein n=1 Tax=Oryza sativa subsp. indica TaxID=39946 RepID=B8BIT9_ORYSI|nr:hypothetical protein OsI_34920 [Oryza sativa Indica Group]